MVLAAFVILLALFLGLAWLVPPGPTEFDTVVAAWIAPVEPRPGTLSHVFWRDVSALGSGPLVVLVSLGLTAYLALARRWVVAVGALSCPACAALSSFVLKGLFARPRPGALETVIAVDVFSFPSGHSIMAAAVYPMIGVLAARVVRGRRLRVYCVACGVTVMGLIGISRVYLGVHHATDVLAGWCVGSLWALSFWASIRHLQRGRRARPEPLLVERD